MPKIHWKEYADVFEFTKVFDSLSEKSVKTALEDQNIREIFRARVFQLYKKAHVKT